MPLPVAPRAPRLILAAAYLAAFYAVGVLLLLSALVLWTGDWIGNLRWILRLFSSAFGILFAAAFILLAAARRLGFAALWVLLAALWVWSQTWLGWTPIGFLVLFVLWSVVALPFYLLGIVAFPGRPLSHLGRRAIHLPGVVLIVWGFLIVFTVAVTPAPYLSVVGALPTGSFPGPPHAVLQLAPFVWAPFPVLTSIEAFARVWTAQEIAAPALPNSVEV